MESFRRKLELDEQALAEDPRNAVARGDMAYSRKRMGDLFAQGGRYSDALASYRMAIALRESNAEPAEDLYARYTWFVTRASMGEMHARLGEIPAALEESAWVMRALEAIPADPSSGTRSSLRGQVYMRVAAIHAVLGDARKLDAAERRAHWQAARNLNAQSLAVWQDMQARGILTAEDATKTQEVAAEIARCDAALRELAG
jgi:tetratricopeptide (TPR) repeat protein